MRKNTWQIWSGWLFALPWLIQFVFFIVAPFVASFYLSLTNYRFRGAPKVIGWDNYVELFTDDPLFWKSVGNTIYYTVIHVPGQIVIAFLIALLLISLYIAIRFDRYYALGSLAALVHDVLLTIGILSLFNIEIGITIIAALLTIVGYSLNDTIVVYDRIRENIKKLMNHDRPDVVNQSLNETLNRTIVTSITTLVVVVVLYFYGGAVLRPFSFTLIIGILIGTYSSIFIASPIMLYFEEKYPIPEYKEEEE